MSKSKGNVVSPDPFVERYGSDVFRMYLMFMGPFTDGGDWSDTGIKGIDRFVQRVWKTLSEKSNAKTKDDKETLTKLHRTIKSVTEGYETLHFNTAIASMMELLNVLEQKASISTDTAMIFAKLLSPVAPHLADELWSTFGSKEFIVDQEWPLFDPMLLVSDTMTIAVQVNGKLRGTVTIASNASKEDIIAEAKKEPNVAKYIEMGVKKEIYVTSKLVSFVV